MTAAYTSNQPSRQFIFNPPHLVRALISSKLGEAMFRRKCEDLVQSEMQLRNQIKDSLIRLKESQLQRREGETSDEYEI